jgi:hypothetical protein
MCFSPELCNSSLKILQKKTRSPAGKLVMTRARGQPSCPCHVRFTPESGRRSVQSAGPLRAISRHHCPFASCRLIPRNARKRRHQKRET